MSMNIIQVSKLRKEFGKIVAVDNVSFNVEKGEIFGFLGPNGAGKTTVINMLDTLLLPTSGIAKLAGHDIIKEPDSVRKNIGLIPQETVLESMLTAKENLEFYAKLYHVPEKQYTKSIQKLLELVNLSNRANDLVQTYSGGMKRRLEIAKALLHRPKLIFMDEPTLGLDPQARRLMWEYIRKLNKEEGVTIFLTTHYLEEADFLCDRVAIIDYGKIKAMDTPAKLKEELAEGNIIDVKPENGVQNFVSSLKTVGYKPEILGDGTVRIVVSKGKETVPKIFKIAEKLKIRINSISMHEPTLEDVFIHHTGKSIRDETAEQDSKKMLRLFR